MWPKGLHCKFKRDKSPHLLFPALRLLQVFLKLLTPTYFCFSHCNITVNIFPLISMGILKRLMNYWFQDPAQMSGLWWSLLLFPQAKSALTTCPTVLWYVISTWELGGKSDIQWPWRVPGLQEGINEWTCAHHQRIVFLLSSQIWWNPNYSNQCVKL